MSIKEKLQQLQVDRARQEAERVRREQEARELESARLVAAEARKNAEIHRVKGILDSKGITKMMHDEVLPIVQEISPDARLNLSQETITVGEWRKGDPKYVDAIGMSTWCGSLHLGIFVEVDNERSIHICSSADLTELNPGGLWLKSLSRISAHDIRILSKTELLLAEILSEPDRFFHHPSPEDPRKGTADYYP